MTTPLALLKAIRAGRLLEVRALLDAGVPPEFDDGQGDPGLPLGMACFMGFNDIARELIERGARVNRPDNRLPTSPLAMAVKGRKPETVRLLLEMGADLPEGMETGLSAPEVMLAQLKAIRNGYSQARTREEASQAETFEEIQVSGCSGLDTQVLEADVIRAAQEMALKHKP